MDRREVERRLGLEIPRILAETTAVSGHGGRARDGHCADPDRPKAACSRRPASAPGDVLTQINDTVIDGLPTLIGLCPRLQSARELRAVVLRNGVPVSLNVSLK